MIDTGQSTTGAILAHRSTFSRSHPHESKPAEFVTGTGCALSVSGATVAWRPTGVSDAWEQGQRAQRALLLRGEDVRTAWHDERREKAMQSVSVSGESEGLCVLCVLIVFYYVFPEISASVNICNKTRKKVNFRFLVCDIAKIGV